MCHRDRYFELVDTGGMGVEDVDNLTQHVEEQITAAIESAAVILFVVDTRDGLVPLDQKWPSGCDISTCRCSAWPTRPTIAKFDSQADEFYRLGPRQAGVHQHAAESQSRTAAGHDRRAAAARRASPIRPQAEPTMKVAIVGRRNTGKSTLVNTLAHAERMIVSEVPGTTRDSVDVRFELDGKSFLAIDTPGLRRRKSITTDIDFYSTHRAQRSIRRADVVLLFFDPTERISKVDKQLCDYIASQYKPCIFVVNKWDLMADGMPTERWVGYLRDTFRTMWYVPIAFITGQTGKNVKAMLNHAQMLFKQALHRVTTGELNRVVQAALEANPPPLYQQPHAEDFLRHASRHRAADDRAILQRSAGAFAALSPLFARRVPQRLPFSEVPIKLYLRKREDTRDSGGRSAESSTHEERGRGGRKARAVDRLPRSQRSAHRLRFRALHLPASTVHPSPLPPMIVGVPKETKRDEYRVGILPVGVEELARAGHQVLVERGRGHRVRPARRSLQRARGPAGRYAPRSVCRSRDDSEGQGAAAD